MENSLKNGDSMNFLDSKNILMMLRRALNMVDPRLIDHGIKVALVLQDMLRAEGRLDEQAQKQLWGIAFLHDVGIYHTEEIDRLVQVENSNVWEHSVCGYLFLRDHFSDPELSKVVLYHHADYRDQWNERKEVLHYGQLLHIADRVCIWHDELHRSKDALNTYFTAKRGVSFSPDGIDLFWKADALYETWASLDETPSLDRLTACTDLLQETAESYLLVLASAIDFRSHNTVIHTRAVAEIGVEMARLLKFPVNTQEKIYCAALLHDLGKIGIPIEILEKPGRLTPEEMAVMRRHIELGEEIVSGCVDQEIVQMAMRHHEKLNGSGYPRGLSAADLTLPQRLLAVADILSALCMARSYKDAFPKENCLAILHDMAKKGEIDQTLVALVDREFDHILATAQQRCMPIQEKYEKAHQHFQLLMDRLQPTAKTPAVHYHCAV